MGRPYQDIKIYSVQDRRSQAMAKKPWLARWQIDGRQRSKSFRTRAEAERFRSLLLQATHVGESFDVASGEPVSWLPGPEDMTTAEWARRWLAEQWDEWQPRTRRAALEALSRFVTLTVPSAASTTPTGLRAYLEHALAPDYENLDVRYEAWLARWSVPLRSLNKALLADVDRRLGVGAAGQALAPATASRYRKTPRTCIRRAVALDLLTDDPWPPSPRGRSRRKAIKTRKHIDVERLPDPATFVRAIAAIGTHQPGSRKYQVMTALVYYAGLRPSEVVMLRLRSLHLPDQGWGRINVTEADIDHDVPGEPKTGPRPVPIPPVLVDHLRHWIDTHTFAAGDLLFRTRNNRRPTASNWSRAWHRALRSIGHPTMRIYDCRHAAATTWLKAGVPLGEVAARLGHSVETLVTTYIGALQGDEELANQRIQKLLNSLATPTPEEQPSDATPHGQSRVA